MTGGQDGGGPGWVVVLRDVGGVLVAVGPLDDEQRAELLGLALAEGFGIQRIGTARLLDPEDATARLRQQRRSARDRGKGNA